MNSIRTNYSVVILTITCVVLLTATSVFATRKEWSGLGSDYKWSTNSNWKGVFGPNSNDDLAFLDSILFINGYFSPIRRAPNVNDLPINTRFKTLTIEGNSWRISGNQIILDGGMTLGNTIIAGSDPNPSIEFSPNILLGATQTWTMNFGRAELSGVINLNSRGLTISTLNDLEISGPLNGIGSLTKSGGGNLIISGLGTTTATTLISDGTVQVDGRIGPVLLNSGTLSGRGVVEGKVGVTGQNLFGGAIAPGNGGNTTGVLSLEDGTVKLSSSTRLDIDLNGSTVGTQYDQLRVSNGDLLISGTDLRVNLGFIPFAGQQFVIVNQLGAGSVGGQFRQGNSITANGQLFQITYLLNGVILTCLGPAIP